MGIGSLGMSELVVIFIIVLVFFGPRRFPEIARSMGHAMREFRRSLNQIQRELEDADPRSSIPGRDFLNDIRSGKPGKWLDPNTPRADAEAARAMATTPGDRSPPETSDPPVTGESAGAASTETDPEEQLPMFEGETEPRDPVPTDDRPDA